MLPPKSGVLQLLTHKNLKNGTIRQSLIAKIRKRKKSRIVGFIYKTKIKQKIRIRRKDSLVFVFFFFFYY